MPCLEDLSGQEVSVLGLTIALSLYKGKSDKEIKTLINLLNLITDNLTIIYDQNLGIADEQAIL